MHAYIYIYIYIYIYQYLFKALLMIQNTFDVYFKPCMHAHRRGIFVVYLAKHENMFASAAACEIKVFSGVCRE